MKKLLKGMAAGLAVLLGFASCSGNLQDNDPKDFPLYVVGDIALDEEGKGTRLPFTFEKFDADGNEIMSYSFTYSASKMTAWGGGKGTANFKIVSSSDPNDWTKDWGGEKDKAVEDVVIQDVAKTDTNEYKTLEMRKGGNTNPGNVIVKDLTDNGAYKLYVKYNRAEDTVSIKLEGVVTYIPKFYVVQTGKDPIEMNRAGSVYSWEFKAEKEETLSFVIRQDDNEWYAYSTEDTVASAEAMSFGTVESLEPMTFTCAKDMDYKITVNATDTSAITISGGLNNILGGAGVAGDFNGYTGQPVTVTGKDTAEFAFEGVIGGLEFSVQEVCGTWTPRWFAGIPEGKDKPATPTMAGDVSAKKKGSVSDADYVEMLYYEADPGMAGAHVKVTGLPLVGSYKFKLLFKVLDAEKKIISVACEAQEDIPESAYSKNGYTDLTEFGVAGNMNGWDTSANLTKISDHVWTYEFKGDGDAKEFGLQTKGWSTKYTGATLTAPAELNKESDAVTLEKGAGANNKITATTFDATYVLTFTANDDWSVSATIKQTTAGGEKPSFSLDSYKVSGLFNGWANDDLTKVSDTVYTYEFTAVDDSGTNVNNCFGLQTGGWATKFTGATIAVGGEAQTLEKGASDNNQITGCTTGSKYKITFTITDAEKEVVTASVAAVE